jgi:hypothetical protein
MVTCKVVRTVGYKFGYDIRRSEGFLLGIQVALRKRGGVQLSLFGWCLFIGKIPVQEVSEGLVAGGDALDAMLEKNGKDMELSVCYTLDSAKSAKKAAEVQDASVQG